MGRRVWIRMARLWYGAEKCVGHAWCRLGPKLMNHCRPEKTDTKEHGKMLKILLKLEEGRVPHGNAKGWKVEGDRRRVTRRECKRLGEEFGVGGFVAQKDCGTLPRGECWKTEERYPEREAKSDNTMPCTRKTFSVVG